MYFYESVGGQSVKVLSKLMTIANLRYFIKLLKFLFSNAFQNGFAIKKFKFFKMELIFNNAFGLPYF